jgi:transketolase
VELFFVKQTTLEKHIELSYSGNLESRKFVSDALRLNTLSMIMEAGSGHIGSSFSAMDIVLSVYLDLVMPEGNKNLQAKYISSKGHDAPGLYSILIAFGIIDEEKKFLLRRINGLPGHPDVSTPGITANTGSLGMGISKAKGILEANRIFKKIEPVIVLTGDGELQEGQIWESLAGAVNRKLNGLLVFVDHNKIQSDTWVDKVSSIGDIQRKFESFGWQVERIDGHDLSSISLSIQNWKKNQLPTVVIADTVKGKGCSFMEIFPEDGDFYKFHSGATSVKDYENAISEISERLINIDSTVEFYKYGKSNKPQISGDSFLESWKKELVNSGKKNNKIIVLDADLTLDTGTSEFSKVFTDRYIQFGIAEQDMVSAAGGLALSGLLPIVHSFASFLSGRAHEQIIVNSTEETKIVYVGALAGLIPGGPGHSHQAVSDVNSFGSVNNILIFEPCHPRQVNNFINVQLEKHTGPSYIRFTSVPLNFSKECIPEAEVPIGEASLLKEGDLNCLILVGGLPTSLVSEGFDEFRDLNLKILSTPWVNRINQSWYLSILEKIKRVTIVQNYNINSGFDINFRKFLDDNSLDIKVKVIGIEEIPKSGTNLEVLKYHGFTIENIKRVIDI